MEASHLVGALICGTIALSCLAVGLFRALAQRWNILDVPNERSSHFLPTPLGGGVVLVVINVIAWLAIGAVRGYFSLPHALVLATGALLVAAVSLKDDLGHVPYPIRLAVHAAAALLVVLGYGYWHSVDLPVLGTVPLGLVGPLLTVLWIVGLTNAYNFMDGIDGMAAGQASVAGLGWVAIGWFTGVPVLVVVGGLLGASSIGLLTHNWQPARIFMGDVGATFLGYSLAVLPIIGAHHDPRLALTGVLLVWPAIFDSLFTVMRRLRNHGNIFVGHQTFLFHRLVQAGWSHAAVSSLYLVFPVLGALLAFGWERGNRLEHAGAVLAAAVLCLTLWLLVRHEERRLATTDSRTPRAPVGSIHAQIDEHRLLEA